MNAVIPHDRFSLPAQSLQRVLWERGWAGLRNNQVAALPLILDIGLCIEIRHTTQELVEQRLLEIGAQPCPEAVLQTKDMGNSEKWDWVLPDDLFLASYASRALALADAHALCKILTGQRKTPSGGD